MEPYNYVITRYPLKEEKEQGMKPIIMNHGILIADSQLSAYKEMINLITIDQTLEAEQIEFMAKPFITNESCQTKKDISRNMLYNFYLNNSTYELRTSTASLEDFMKGTFLNYTNDSREPELPQAMMMIDVIALLNDDKKL